MTTNQSMEQRLLRVIRDFNAALPGEAGGQADIMEIACGLLVGVGGFASVWIGMIDGFERGKLRVGAVAGSGLVLQERDRLDIVPGDLLETAVSADKPTVYPGDAVPRNWRGPDVKATVFLPLRANGGAIGLLVANVAEDGTVFAEALSMLGELAAFVSRSLDAQALAGELDHARRLGDVFSEKFQRSLISTIRSIVTALEERDPYTAGHQKRVSALSRAIGQAMGLNDYRLNGLRFGAMIHDIGKFRIPAELLSRPGKLFREEMGLIRIHPTVGAEIIHDVEFPWPVARMIRQHHERWDGSGYPDGLLGPDTLLEARVIAVADVVEAMSSHRPYRPALGSQIALEEIRKNSGIQYDPAVVEACLGLFAAQSPAVLFGEEPAVAVSAST